MKNRNHHLIKSQGLAFLALLFLLVTASCGDGGKRGNYSRKDDNNPCFLTPKLKNISKDYDIFYSKDGLFEVRSRTPLVDETGKSFFPVGYVNKDGQEVLPVKYYGLNYQGDGVFIVSERTNQGVRFGLLDIKGNEIAPIVYELISLTTPNKFNKNYSVSFFEVKKNGLTGLMDKNGNIVIPIQYKTVSRFYVDDAYRDYKQEELPDIYCVQKNGKLEVFNLSPEKMKDKPSTPYDVNWVGEDGKQSFMDYQGHIIAGPYQNIRISGGYKIPLFPEGLVAVVKNNKIGFIDMQGNVKIPFNFYYSEFWFNYTSLSSCVFNEGLAAMMNSGKKWGYIDKTGKVVIPYVYDGAALFHQGSAIVEKGNSLGLIDKNNNVILPFEFENGVFTGNVYVMCQNNKWGVYSPQGQCITPCQYEQLITFFEGYATVVKDGKKGLIDEQGQVVIPCDYKSVLYDVFSQLVYVENENGKRGFLDTNNQVVLPIEFDDVGALENGQLFGVKKDGRYGLYDLCGNCTLE